MAAELSYISAFSSPIKVVHSKDINSQYDSLMKYPKPCTDQRKNDIMIGKKNTFGIEYKQGSIRRNILHFSINKIVDDAKERKWKNMHLVST